MAVADNSIKFWDSMCDIFGITKDGNELQETTCKINTNNSGIIILLGILVFRFFLIIDSKRFSFSLVVLLI